MKERKRPPAIYLGKGATNNTFVRTRIIGDGPGVEIEGSGNRFLDYEQIPASVYIALRTLDAQKAADLASMLRAARSDAEREVALRSMPSLWQAVRSSIAVGSDLASIVSMVLSLLSK